MEELGIGLKEKYSIYDVDDAYKVVLDVLMDKHEFPEPPKDAPKEVGCVVCNKDIRICFCMQGISSALSTSV